MNIILNPKFSRFYYQEHVTYTWEFKINYFFNPKYQVKISSLVIIFWNYTKKHFTIKSY